MKKYIYKFIAQYILNECERLQYGYEMGCLISAEFCPAPDFDYVEAKLLVICHKYGVTKQAFIHWAEEQSRKWEHPYQSPPYWGFLCEQIMWADIEPFPEVLEDYYTSKEFEKSI